VLTESSEIKKKGQIEKLFNDFLPNRDYFQQNLKRFLFLFWGNSFVFEAIVSAARMKTTSVFFCEFLLLGQEFSMRTLSHANFFFFSPNKN
jgi:hypothetical protein